MPPRNLCLGEGAAVVLSSSYDEKHPPTAVLDGRDDTFFATTGMYPQELVVALGGSFGLNSVQVRCLNVKTLDVFTSCSEQPEQFSRKATLDLSDSDGAVQTAEKALSQQGVTHVKLRLAAGHRDFSAIYTVKVMGS